MALTFILWDACFIGKVSHCTSSILTDCLRLVEYYCDRCIAVSSIPASGYFTDRFAINNGVHDCTFATAQIFLSRSTTCLQTSVNLLTSLQNFGTLSRNVYRMRAV